MAKLVAIGDSLTQGFQSLAITHVDLSYPAMIAECMGLLEHPHGFRTPDFRGAGGLPCNLEWIARRVSLQTTGGSSPGSPFRWPASVFDVVSLLDEVEDYWERGLGSQPTANDVLYHNLAVWGFEAGDAYNITAAKAWAIATMGTKDDWFHPPSEPRMRTAWRVLNPSLGPARMADTQIEAAKRIKQRDGSIENLIVWLGANNCLGTVVELDMRDDRITGDDPPGPFSGCTLWTPKAFEKEYARLAAHIDEIGASRVLVATIPHVTIVPIAKGIMQGGGTTLPKNEKHFDYYTRFFVSPQSFDPKRDRHITKAEAERVDAYIDTYNATICAEAKKRGWIVVDTCKMLDDLAVKRNEGKPTYTLPKELDDLNVLYIQFDESGALQKGQGGLISLDGVHPTTCGYAVIAQAFIRAINDAMKRESSTAAAADRDPIPEPNFKVLRENDALVSAAPHSLHDIEGMLRFLERRFHIMRWISPPTNLA